MAKSPLACWSPRQAARPHRTARTTLRAPRRQRMQRTNSTRAKRAKMPFHRSRTLSPWPSAPKFHRHISVSGQGPSRGIATTLAKLRTAMLRGSTPRRNARKMHASRSMLISRKRRDAPERRYGQWRVAGVLPTTLTANSPLEGPLAGRAAGIGAVRICQQVTAIQFTATNRDPLVDQAATRPKVVSVWLNSSEPARNLYPPGED